MIKSNLSRDEEIIRKADEIRRASTPVEESNESRLQKLELAAGVNRLAEAKQTIKQMERNERKIVRNQEDALKKLQGLNPHLGPQGKFSSRNFNSPSAPRTSNRRMSPFNFTPAPLGQVAQFQTNITEGPKNIAAEGTERVVAPPFAPITDIPPFYGPTTMTIRSYSPPSDRPSPNDLLPSGSIVMFHLWSGESLSTFFDTGTGLGTGRWAGWALCDGQIPDVELGATPDLGAKFVAGYKSSDGDYDEIGPENAGVPNGFKWHGDVLESGQPNRNNHSHHSLKHSHYSGVTVSPAVEDCAVGGTGAYAWPTTGPAPTWSLTACHQWNGYDSTDITDPADPIDYDAPQIVNGTGFDPAGTSEEVIAKHDGPFNSGTACDNRPPFYVSYFAIKL